jgi:hypothetical protein
VNWKAQPTTPRITLLVLALLLAALLLQACSLVSPEAAADPTLSALSESVARTATAQVQEDSSSNTLATAEAEATARSQEIFATQTAQSAGRDAFTLATATVAAPIVAELPQYGLDANSGRVGWLHDPLTLELSGYHVFDYGNDHINVTAADFVMAADIYWDTQYGGSGCGFMFRSNGDQDNPSQYMVIATRFANGRVIFSALAEGEIANLHDFYPHDFDRSFEWRNESTNRLAVVARGNLIEVYTNGVKIGEVDTTQPPKTPALPARPQPPLDKENQAAMNQYQAELQEYEQIAEQAQQNYQAALRNYQERQAVFDNGFQAMLALSESGRTLCRFENAWLWLLETPE